MKKIVLTSVLVFLSILSYSQNIYDQLHNSVERTEGGAGAEVEYHVYFSPTNEKIFYAKDWEKGEVAGQEDGSVYFELTRKNGGEEESLLINLNRVVYTELEVKTAKGNTVFKYHFYY